MTDRLDEIKRLLAEARGLPWSRGVVGVGANVFGDDDSSVAVVPHENNAHLITAAPELLAWCVETIEGLERGLAGAVDGQVGLEREADQLR